MFRNPIFFVFLLALILRLGYFLLIQHLHPDSIYQFDSWGYLRLAYNGLHHGVLSQLPEAPLTPDSTRTPLYPAYIMLFHLLKLPGYWIVFFQALFGAATAAYTCQLVQLMNKNKTIILIAGLLVAIDLPSIFMGNVVGTEPLFTLCFISGIYFLVIAVKQKKQQPFYIALLLLALATLVRPITWWVVWILPLLYIFIKTNKLKNPLKHLAMQYLLLLVLLSPWVIRNYNTFDKVFFSSIAEVNLLFHTSTQIRSATENRTQHSLEMEYRTDSLGHLDFVNNELAIPEFIEFARTESGQVMLQNPFEFASMWGISFVMFFVKPMRSYFNLQLKGVSSYSAVASVEARKQGNLALRFFSKTDKLTIVLVIMQIVLLGLMYFGILIGIKNWLTNHITIAALLLLLIAYLASISALTEVDARFRIPAIPLLSILAAPGIYTLLLKLKLVRE